MLYTFATQPLNTKPDSQKGHEQQQRTMDQPVNTSDDRGVL
jgi:hypothetical protein